jgi:hypothetical protein
MTTQTANDTLSRPPFDYGPLPETPPAHIWALKALRNQLLGTRASPLATGGADDEIDEVDIFGERD